jgi:hypothetical protein
MAADFELMLAKRRVDMREPFTPEWDAAIREVVDRELEVSRLDVLRASTERVIGES